MFYDLYSLVLNKGKIIKKDDDKLDDIDKKANLKLKSKIINKAYEGLLPKKLNNNDEFRSNNINNNQKLNKLDDNDSNIIYHDAIEQSSNSIYHDAKEQSSNSNSHNSSHETESNGNNTPISSIKSENNDNK
jgi:hypothetical protein